MKEEFLHYVWRMKKFDLRHLYTTEGQPLEVLHFGTLNPNAGPDFSDARIRIGDTLWAGNIEMHLKASDWTNHQHQSDKSYESVILHVVLEEDQPAQRHNGERIPCLELKQRIPADLSTQYLRLMQQERWIPCQHQFYQSSEIVRQLWFDRMLVERLQRKTQTISSILQDCNNDWEETFYILLCGGLGAKVNADPFKNLARITPLSLLHPYKDNLMQLEALLFGQAGFLESNYADPYPNQLKKEYEFLKKKHGLRPMGQESWKFLRMRPANFPTLRIAQLAHLLFHSFHLFSKSMAARFLLEVENLFKAGVSSYWLNHYTFDKISTKKQKHLGKDAIHLLTINTLSPMTFFYGDYKNDEAMKLRAMKWLEGIPAENNAVIDQWKALGVEPRSAYDSQAFLQLKNEYCDAKKCLQCSIGHEILR